MARYSARYRVAGGGGVLSPPLLHPPLPEAEAPLSPKKNKKEKIMKKIEFQWAGIPPKSTFQQRNKNFLPTASCRLAMAQWTAILEQHVPDQPFKEAVAFQMIVTWPHTRETLKRNHGLPVPKTTRPDGVNILKGVEDIMTKLGFWIDDSILAFEAIERWHGDYPGVLFIITEIGK